MSVGRWNRAVGFAALLAAGGWAAPAPDSAALGEARRTLAHLIERQRQSPCVKLRFASQTTGPDGGALPKTQGALWIADSGRFRVEHAGNVVVCDGRTLWQYVPANRQVIIKNAPDAAPGAESGMLLRFLGARPLAAERAGRGLLRVTLDPKAAEDNLDSLHVLLGTQPPALRRVETVDVTGARTEYEILACDYAARPRPDEFTFTPPSGVETVDMR